MWAELFSTRLIMATIQIHFSIRRAFRQGLVAAVVCSYPATIVRIICRDVHRGLHIDRMERVWSIVDRDTGRPVGIKHAVSSRTAETHKTDRLEGRKIT